MDDLSLSKYSIELKQTSKGLWYIGSLKINVNSIEEFNSLIDGLALDVEAKIKKLNDKTEAREEVIQEKEEIILSLEDERLFNHLKEVRLELARKEGYPPYIIFHDSTLRQMAKQKPQSHESMRELIGEKKFEKYGKIFVREIFQFE